MGTAACREAQDDGVPSSSDNSRGEGGFGIATAADDAAPTPATCQPAPREPPESRHGDPAGDADGVRSGSTALPPPPADAEAMSSANHSRGADKNATTSAIVTRAAGFGSNIPASSRRKSGANCSIRTEDSSSGTAGLM